MTDVAPELINSIKETFNELISKSPRYAKLQEMAIKGTATYADAHKLAIELGDALTKAYKLKLSSDVLPDGRMYYNIAERLLNETLRIPQTDLSEYCECVQTAINDAADIGMKVAVPEVNQDRIDGIIERLSEEIDFDKIEWILDDPIKNLLQSEVDDFVKENAESQTKAGLEPRIVRTLVGRACKWCSNLAGVYKYSQVSNTGNDVFRRHENCRCTVAFVDGKTYTDVHKKIQYGNGVTREEALNNLQAQRLKQQAEKRARQENRDFWINKLMEERGYSAKRAAIYYNVNKMWLE